MKCNILVVRSETGKLLKKYKTNGYHVHEVDPDLAPKLLQSNKYEVLVVDLDRHPHLISKVQNFKGMVIAITSDTHEVPTNFPDLYVLQKPMSIYSIFSCIHHTLAH